MGEHRRDVWREGEGQRWHISQFQTTAAPESASFLLWRRKPQGSPLSRWGCVSRTEAIRPAIILHLLFLHRPGISHKQGCPKTQKIPSIARKVLTEHDGTKWTTSALFPCNCIQPLFVLFPSPAPASFQLLHFFSLNTKTSLSKRTEAWESS